MHFVYELTDPREEIGAKPAQKIYVGITTDPSRRFAQHLIDRISNDEKAIWIQSLRAEKLLPSLKIREMHELKSMAEQREAHWIHYHETNGAYVLNIHKRLKKLSNALEYSVDYPDIRNREDPLVKWLEFIYTDWDSIGEPD